MRRDKGERQQCFDHKSHDNLGVGLDAIAGTRVASTLVPVGRTMTGVGQNTLSIRHWQC